MRFIEGDVTALRGADVGSGFRLVLDFGTAHGLKPEALKALAREVSALAAADATLLMYATAPRAAEVHCPVVIDDAVRVSDDIREQADRLAAAGYLAFAPDLYSGPRLRCVLATMAAFRSARGRPTTTSRPRAAGSPNATNASGASASSASIWAAALPC